MISRKKKQCKVCQKQDYIFSKGRCKPCAQKDYYSKAQAKKQPSKSIRPTKRHKEAKKKEYANMAKVWEEKQDFEGGCNCEECGKYIEALEPANCAHVFSKGAAPHLRDHPDNIIILCFDCHQVFDFGKGAKTRKDMKVWPKVQRLLETFKGA